MSFDLYIKNMFKKAAKESKGFYHQKGSIQAYWERKHKDYVVEFLKDRNISGIILELGCGNGSFACELMDKCNVQVVAMDSVLEMVKLVPKKLIRVVGDARNLPFKKRAFYAVTMMELLQHLKPSQQIKVLMEATRCTMRYVIFQYLDIKSPLYWVIIIYHIVRDGKFWLVASSINKLKYGFNAVSYTHLTLPTKA